MPSLSETMMNCEFLKCVRSIDPMFCGGGRGVRVEA
jgi:hypothetical protein